MVRTHFQPGGEVCESATLPDGRVIRVVGFEHYRSVTAELRAWLALLGLAVMLFGCGGAAFSPGVEQPVDSSPAEASTPDDAGRGGSADADGGDKDAAAEAAQPQDAGCDRCSCPPEGAVCANPIDAADECLLFTHSDGIGQTWQDCTPPSTYDLAEAQAACGADSSPCFQHSCAGGDEAVCDRDPAVSGYCTCWTYAGPDVGHVNSEPCTGIVDAFCGGSVTWQ